MKFMYLYFGVVIIFVIGYQIFMFIRANKRKKEVLEQLEKNPKAAKVYIKTNSGLLASMFILSSIRNLPTAPSPHTHKAVSPTCVAVLT